MRAARPHRAAPRAALPRSAPQEEARTRQIPFHRPFQRPALCDKLRQGRTVSEARAADLFCSMHFLEASARCLLVAVRQPGTTAGRDLSCAESFDIFGRIAEKDAHLMRKAAAGGRPAAPWTMHAIEIPGKLLAHRAHQCSCILHAEAGMLEEAHKPRDAECLLREQTSMGPISSASRSDRAFWAMPTSPSRRHSM